MAESLGPIGAVRFYKVSEVAEALRVSKMSVYRLIHAGDMEAIQVGRNFRVPAHAVDAYLRASLRDVG